MAHECGLGYDNVCMRMGVTSVMVTAIEHHLQMGQEMINGLQTLYQEKVQPCHVVYAHTLDACHY